jgi:hypothetical protein
VAAYQAYQVYSYPGLLQEAEKAHISAYLVPKPAVLGKSYNEMQKETTRYNVTIESCLPFCSESRAGQGTAPFEYRPGKGLVDVDKHVDKPDPVMHALASHARPPRFSLRIPTPTFASGPGRAADL